LVLATLHRALLPRGIRPTYRSPKPIEGLAAGSPFPMATRSPVIWSTCQRGLPTNVQRHWANLQYDRVLKAGTKFDPHVLNHMPNEHTEAASSPGDIPARYRVYAAECIDLARAAPSLKSKLLLLDTGRAWLDLADQNERNADMVRIFHLPCDWVPAPF
jgi:hypothetical protein